MGMLRLLAVLKGNLNNVEGVKWPVFKMKRPGRFLLVWSLLLGYYGTHLPHSCQIFAMPAAVNSSNSEMKYPFGFVGVTLLRSPGLQELGCWCQTGKECSMQLRRARNFHFSRFWTIHWILDCTLLFLYFLPQKWWECPKQFLALAGSYDIGV